MEGQASRPSSRAGRPALNRQASIGRGSGYNSRMPKSPRHTSHRYTAEHASAGLDHDFPEIETWPNQFPGYEIVVDDPEFTSVCPKTGLPDFGNIVIRYVPDRLCLELKSLKEYLQAYRNLGIFQENVVNQVLEDVVRWARPVWAEVKGEFRPRGGISTVVIARWPRGKKSQK
jgi:7-cyano-7-deazaguanine reductase